MKLLKQHHALAWMVGFGLLLRIIFNNIVYSPDASSFVIWAQYLFSHRLVDLYEFLPSGYLSYPPAYYYVLKVLGFILSLFQLGNNEWLSLLIVKIPIFIADSIIAVLVYRLVFAWTHKQKVAVISSAFYFLHPAVIYTVSVWGQIDSIITCLTLVSLWLLLNKKTFGGLIFFTISCLVKLQTLALLPLILFWLVTKVPKRKILLYVAGCLGIVIVVFLPLLFTKGISWTVTYFYSLPNQYPYTSVYAYNLWSIFGFLKSDGLTLFGIAYKYLGICIFLVLSLLILWPLKNQKQPAKPLMFAAFLLWFSFAFFSTRMHSRYLIYSLGFIAPFITQFPDLAIGLSFLMIANLLLPIKYPPLQAIVNFLNQKNTIIFFVLCAFALFYLGLKKYYQLLNNETHK